MEQEGLRRPFEPYDAAGADARGPRRPARARHVHDRPGHREGLRRRDLGRARAAGSAPGCTSRTCRAFVPAGSPLDRGAAQRGNSVYIPGRVAPMLPPELADDLLQPAAARRAALRHGRGALRRGSSRASPSSTARSSAATSGSRTGGREEILGGRARRSRGRAEALAARRPARGRATAAPLRARRAADRDAVRSTFAFDGQGGIERAWLETEPTAHALVEELMILANEAVGALLADRAPRCALPRARAARPAGVGLLLAKLADARGADAARARRATMTPGERGRARRRGDSERVTDYVEQSGPRPRGVSRARAPRAEAGALRPAQPRPLGPREPRVLPLHVADPPLSRPRLPPRAAARARRLGRAARPRTSRGRRAHLGERARGGAGRVPGRRASASRGCSSASSSSAAGRSRSTARSSA